MSGKVARLATVVACAAALGSAPSSERLPDAIDPVPLTATESKFFRQYFDDGVVGWAGKGVQLHVRLGLVSGNDRVNCLMQTITSGDSAQYCPPTKTVIITANTVHEAQRNNVAQGAFIVFHELGHAVQDAEGRMRPWDIPNFELGATCLAGEVMRGTPEVALVLMANVEHMLSNSPIDIAGSDIIHGTGEQQLAAFYHGFSQQNCEVYGY